MRTADRRLTMWTLFTYVSCQVRRRGVVMVVVVMMLSACSLSPSGSVDDLQASEDAPGDAAATAAMVQLLNATALAIESLPTPNLEATIADDETHATSVGEATTATPEMAPTTPTMPTVSSVQPTATPPAALATPTLQQNPAPPAVDTPTPEPQPTQAVPTPPLVTQPNLPAGQPFQSALIPLNVLQHSKASLEPGDFFGGYRRDDGVLYGRPALHLYGLDSSADVASASFFLAQAPTSYVVVSITGMDDEREQHTRMRLSVNGTSIWEGSNPFRDEEWTSIGWMLTSPEICSEGWNQITIENLDPNGEIGAVPWILVTVVDIYAD